MDIHKIFPTDFWNKLIAILIISIIVIYARSSSLDLPILEIKGNQIAVEEASKQIYLNSGKSTNLGIEPEVIEAIIARPHLWQERGKQLADKLKTQRQYIDDDGNSRTFISGYDSYHWLRLARNVIETGTHCDDGTSDPCRNQHSLAPIGHEQNFMALPHVYSIVWTHKLITFFDPDFPLAASAFCLSLFLAVLIIIPSFFIGNILTGFRGGVGTAILISFAPIILNRTMGIDTDAWNVLLLLCMLWLTMESFLREKFSAKLLWIILAGLITGLWATIWSGWVLGYLIILSGLFLQIFISVIHKHQRKLIFHDLIIIIAYYLSCGIVIQLGSAEINYFQILFEILQQFLPAEIPSLNTQESTSSLNWPDHLKTVGEWKNVGITGLFSAHGGRLLFLLSLVGGLLLLIPNKITTNKNITQLDKLSPDSDGNNQNKILGICLFSYGIFLIWIPESKIGAFALIYTPLVFALLYRLFFTNISNRRSVTIPGLIIITLFACLWIAYGAFRLLLFSWIPVSILLIVTINLSSRWLSDWIKNRYEQPVILLLPTIFFFSFISYVALPGVAAMQSFIPQMNSALYKTLHEISDQSDEDVIISGLWEYGYWTQYYADRRTSTDGGTLNNRANYWLSRAFTREDERETIGLLRMLNCSSDASYYQNPQSAIELIKSTGKSEAEAFRLIKKLTLLDRVAADELLHQQINTTESIEQILHATHCTPPESILLTSNEMISKSPGWFSAGIIDPLDLDATLDNPYHYKIIPEWYGCNSSDISVPDLACEVELAEPGKDKQHYLFIIDFSDPESFYLHSKDSSNLSRKPGLLILAGKDQIEIIEPINPDFPQIGILVDRNTNQILIGRPVILKTVYTQLQLLEGRYSQFFEVVSHHSDLHGDNVYAWRVKRWE